MTLTIKTSEARTHVLGADYGTQFSFLLIAEKSLTALEGTITYPKSNTRKRLSDIERIVAFDVADAEDEVEGANPEDVTAADFIPLVIRRDNPNPRMIATLAETVYDRWAFAQKLTEEEHAELLSALD